MPHSHPHLSPQKRMTKRHLWRGTVFLMLAIPVLVAGALLTMMARTLPDVTRHVAMAGLNKDVTAIRDEYGVPHVFAATTNDAWRAVGYLHAQDRYFQMDMARRVAKGQLAAAIGSAGLKYDRLFRTLALNSLSQASVASLSPAAKQVAEAYVAGINQWLEENKARLPVEYTLLDITSAPWTVADCILMGKLRAWMLSANVTQEAYRGRLAARYDKSRIETLFPKPIDGLPITLNPGLPVVAADKLPGHEKTKTNSHHKPLAPQEPPASHDQQGLQWQKLAPQLDALLQSLPAMGAGASNEWAVSGARSKTGKPLLANDPHLDMELPVLWYLVRITTPQGTVAGATAPGTPVVVLGQNDHIAWGLTTTNIDTQDLFIETIDSKDHNRYLTPKGSAPFVTREEIIKVKGAPDERLVVRYTRHGPVFSGWMQGLRDDLLAEDQVAALAWTGLTSQDTTLEGLTKINNARNWTEFMAGVKLFKTPSQNLIYADAAGHIGYVAAGDIPVRRAGNGRYPADGASGAYDWVGLVPFTLQPQLLDPPQGAIVNANNPVADLSNPYWLGYDYDAGWRAQRIETLLAKTPQHDVASMAAIQMDSVAAHAKDFLPYLLQLEPANHTERAALDLLRAWERDHALQMLPDRPEALILEWWLRRMNLRLLASELDDIVDATGPLNAMAVLSVLHKPEGFCRDRDAEGTLSCHSIIKRSFREAMDELADRYGKDLAAWRWGSEHYLTLHQAVLDHVPGFSQIFGDRFGSPGGFYSVNRGGNFGAPDARHPLIHDHGAGFRGVYDLGTPSHSRFMILTGQSGHPLSAHYKDLLPLWRTGQGIPLFRSYEDVAKHHTGVLIFATAQ